MKTKKVFTIALSMAFLLLCSMPALAETVEGQGYAAGSVGSVQYDPYTGQSDVQWSTSYGINPYGNPATTTTTATETATGVRIDSSNATPNGYSYSAGQATDSTRYSDVTRTIVTEEEQYASADVEVAGSSEFFLEAVADSAAANVGIAQAQGVISVNLDAFNTDGDSASAWLRATSVDDYAGGAEAVNFDTTSVFQGAAAATDVEAGASATNHDGWTASVEAAADLLQGFEQAAVANDDGVLAEQSAGVGVFATFTNSASADGFSASTTTSGHQVVGYNGGAGAAGDSWDLNPVHDVSGNWIAVGAYQNYDLGEFVTSTNTATSAAGNSATNSIEAVRVEGYDGFALTGEFNLHADLGGPLAPIDVAIDGAAVAQSVDRAFLFRTASSATTASGNSAWNNVQGIYTADHIDASVATTGSVAVGGLGVDVPFDVAASVMYESRYLGGPFGYRVTGAETGDGMYSASVVGRTQPFGGAGYTIAGAAAGNIGPIEGAAAGRAGLFAWGGWTQTATGGNDTATNTLPFFGISGPWGGGAYDSPFGDGAGNFP